MELNLPSSLRCVSAWYYWSLLRTKVETYELIDQETSEGNKMKARHSGWKALIITCQATEARNPHKGAPNNSPTGQQDKTVLGKMKFDDCQLDTILLSCLIHKGDLNRLPGRFLHC